MKKILIPTLLTLASTPLISLASCKDKDPEPEPEPKEYHILDDYRAGPINDCYIRSDYFDATPNQCYYFKIDTSAWEGSKEAKDCKNCGFFLVDIGFSSFISEGSFKILLDGNPLDKNLYNWNNGGISLQPEGFEKILKSDQVEGEVYSMEGEYSELYFDFLAYKNT